MSNESSTGFLPVLILGAALGAIVALLYAPQPGTETRQLVKEKASEIKEKAARAVSYINESAGATGDGNN